MKTILHILTRGADELPQKVIEAQRSRPDATIDIVDLTAEGADYSALVAKIFNADSVEVW